MSTKLVDSSSTNHNPGALRLGILAETKFQQLALKQLVQAGGYRLQVNALADELDRLKGLNGAEVDAWLVNLPSEQGSHEALDEWLLELDTPVIVSDLDDADASGSDTQLWRRRLLEKLHQLQGAINLSGHPEGAARFVWVLGASTGGPEAVRAFFEALPGDLGASFIYVQHIDSEYQQTLVDIVNKHSHYPACHVSHGDVLPPNKTAIVASAERVELLANGTLAVKPEAWPGAYSPSIDQVFADVARSYGKRCGVIVFSGMAEDGVSGARLVHKQGGQVWVQSPESCTVSSMPDEVLATGVVKVVAAPKALAARLTEFMRRQ